MAAFLVGAFVGWMLGALTVGLLIVCKARKLKAEIRNMLRDE